MTNETKMRVPGELTPLTTRRRMISSGAVAFGMLALTSGGSWAAGEEEILRAEEAIHQEPVFKASRKRVYEALTDANQFGKVVELSAAMKSGGMKVGTKGAEIGREAGGAFSLFGGYITGRQVELVPNERIVQAWRAGSWDPGSYSIAKFVLVEFGGETKIKFDHTGFPKGQAEHLAEGWRTNYWEPLAKFLGEVNK
jgi:activator of HSP90 ATPase